MAAKVIVLNVSTKLALAPGCHGNVVCALSVCVFMGRERGREGEGREEVGRERNSLCTVCVYLCVHVCVSKCITHYISVRMYPVGCAMIVCHSSP